MDTVPRKFVVSVVELFGRKTLDLLDEAVAHRLWKNVVDVHLSNREYYYVYVRMLTSGVQLIAEQVGTEIYEDISRIRKNGRFARIVGIEDKTDCYGYPRWEGAKTLREVDASKQLESVAAQIEQSSRFFARNLRCQDIMLRSLDSMFFGGIRLVYDGQTSLTFLEQQITNSPFLAYLSTKLLNRLLFVAQEYIVIPPWDFIHRRMFLKGTLS
uniref:PHB domain-containing protein n=1 Tax=Steinernema glaseri TaxID=37863 RepID=A0A1I8ASV5_9BILA